MHTTLLVVIILLLVIVASIITSIVTYFILSGRNKRIRLADQYRQIGITKDYLKIQEEIEKIIRSEGIKLTSASPVKTDTDNTENIWYIVRGKDKNTSKKIFEDWCFDRTESGWTCVERNTRE